MEYRITGEAGASAGIQYRSAHQADGSEAGYQTEIDDAAQKLGRIVDNRDRGVLVENGTRGSIASDGRKWADPLLKPEHVRSAGKPGEWNTYRIRATASHVEIWSNGGLMSSLDDHQNGAAKFDGRLALQLHSGKGPLKVEFRNVKVEDLGTSEPAISNSKIVVETSAAQAAPVPSKVVSIVPVGTDGKSLNLNFETGTLEGWKAEGDAWEGQPIKGDTVNPRKSSDSSGHAGEFWIGGYEKVGDKGTGKLTSVSFEVTHPWASFLIGGGRSAQTRVEVVEDATGKVIHTASGADEERMHREAVDLKSMAGKRIFIRLVDESKGGWGHLNFDDFVFHDAQPPATSMIAAASTPRAKGSRQTESPVLWHLESNPAKPTSVANEEAQKVVAGMMLTHGFQAELIAAEPDVKQPNAFAIDARGRLWVVEAYSYPTKQPEGKGKDRILVFEDTKGNGTFDKRTVFIEGLNLVSGIEVGFGGVWIGAAPQFLFIPMADGDDPKPSGPAQILLDGFGYQDTHETLNSFCWGPDGWLYGNQGVFNRAAIGKPGTPENERIVLRAGVWRYHPVRHEFEIFAHGGSNQWGLDFNEVGAMFMTHCRSFYGGGGTTNVIRNGHFWNQANSNYETFVSSSAPDFAPDLKNYLPASARYDSGEGGAGKPGTTAIYGGHSHVGTMIYLGDNWPDIYRDHLFTHNLHGHQMNHQENIRQGSGYETIHAGYDLMYTPDSRYIAVDLQTGPDGSVYVIDWYDQQHCHSPADEKWDRTNGRIYRISWAKTWKPVKVDLNSKSDLELAGLLTHHNDWYCRTAQRLLQERAARGKIDAQAIDSMKQLVATSPDVTRVLRALWTLHVTGALDAEQLTKFAAHTNDLVRAWAIQLATEKFGKSQLSGDVLTNLAKNDPSQSVRLALASALPALEPAQVWDVAAALSAHGEDSDDRFLPKMIWFGLARVIAQDLNRGLALADSTPLPSLVHSIYWFASRQREGRELVLSHVASAPESKAAQNLRLITYALKDEAAVPMPAAWAAIQTRFANSSDHALATADDELAALFGDKAVLAKMRGVLADDKQSMPQRMHAFELLKRSGDPEATPIFASLLDIESMRSAVIPLLSRSSDPATADALMQRFDKLNVTDKGAALNVLTSRTVLSLPLLRATQAAKFDRKNLSALQVRQMRNLHDAEVDKLLDQGWGKLNESSDEMKKTIAHLKKAYSEAPLWAYDANSGRATFTQVCATCHALNGVGAKLGPDLGGSWRNGLDYFLENIVDPNAVVGENFQMHVVRKTDGTVVSGLLDQESDTSITLRTVTETVIIAKSEMKDHKKLAQSLMPPGLLEAMPERKALELLKFLTSKQ